MKISEIGRLVNMCQKASKIKPAVDKSLVKTKDLFCHQYWADARKEGVIFQSNKESVSLHGQLHGINHHFILSPYPKQMDMKFMNTGLTPREMISISDTEFKTLKPLEQKLNVYRCIGEKPDFFSEYPLYLKRLGIKKGEIFLMQKFICRIIEECYMK